MTRWNPSTPDVLGPEFFAYSSAPVTLSRTTAMHQRFRSNAVEAIASVDLYGAVQNNGQPVTYLAEIVALDDIVADGYATFTARPNLLTVTAGIVNDGAGGALLGTGPARIDEWPPNNTDAVAMGPAPASFDLQFATAAFPAGGRIASVAVEVVTDYGWAFAATAAERRNTIVGLVSAGGTYFGPISRTVPNNDSSGSTGREFFSWGEINPATLRPWTVGDLTAFDSAATQVRVSRKAGGTGTWRATAIRLHVVYETRERRLAIGSMVTGAPGAATWLTFPLTSPTGVANWAKPSATRFSLVVRRAGGGSLDGTGPNQVNAELVLCTPGSAPPVDFGPGEIQSYSEVVVSDGGKSLVYLAPAGTQAPSAGEGLFGFSMTTTAPGVSSVDGSPYVAAMGVEVGLGTGQSRQTITGVAASFRGLRLMVGAVDAPTEDLLVRVYRTAGNVLLGTVTITPGEIRADGTLRLLRAFAPAAYAMTAAAHYVDLFSASPTPWVVGLLAANGGAGGVLHEESTFNGAASRATPIDGTVHTALTVTPADFALVLDQAIAPPTGLAAAPSSVTVPPVTGAQCQLGDIPGVSLGWTPTGIGLSFDYYEIQRNHPVYGWQTIAKITDETVVVFQDLEGRLGVAESYRMAAVRVDGAASPWTATVTATATTVGCGYTFTTNEDLARAVGYVDTSDGERDYEFPDEVTYRTLYGRDFQVAFRSPSTLGVTFERDLIISAIVTPTAGVGPRAVDALRGLAAAPVSYVCVRDEAGNRWFGSVTISVLTVLQPSMIHKAKMAFVETTATPSAADAVVC